MAGRGGALPALWEELGDCQHQLVQEAAAVVPGRHAVLIAAQDRLESLGSLEVLFLPRSLWTVMGVGTEGATVEGVAAAASACLASCAGVQGDGMTVSV